MLNNVTIQGRLVNDPQLINTMTGLKMCNFILLCERDKKGTGVDYVNAQCWGIDAVNLCKYKKKNQMILINGRLESGQYDNYKGITIYTLKTIVNQGGIHYLPDQPDARFADVFFERNPAEREFYKKFASAYRKELKEKNKENEENESDSN